MVVAMVGLVMAALKCVSVGVEMMVAAMVMGVEMGFFAHHADHDVDAQHDQHDANRKFKDMGGRFRHDPVGQQNHATDEKQRGRVAEAPCHA